MRVYALGDVHLGLNANKPMDVFGAKWDNHFERIASAWQGSVRAEDLVLIPGDISWAMRLEDALADLSALSKLNGQKLILRGNHDYWWNSLSKLRAALPDTMAALQNDAYVLNGVAVAGSRGWTAPGNSGFGEEDRRIYERELIRLEMSLKCVPENKYVIGMLHYPPLNEKHGGTGFSELFERYKADQVIYGHLHAKACRGAFEGVRNGITYTLCSADHLDFAPKLIAEL